MTLRNRLEVLARELEGRFQRPPRRLERGQQVRLPVQGTSEKTAPAKTCLTAGCVRLTQSIPVEAPFLHDREQRLLR